MFRVMVRSAGMGETFGATAIPANIYGNGAPASSLATGVLKYTLN
jgi:hypothetical protein